MRGPRLAFALMFVDSSTPVPPLVAPFFPVEKTIATTKLAVMSWFAPTGTETPQVVAVMLVPDLHISRSFGWQARPMFFRFDALTKCGSSRTAGASAGTQFVF